MSRTKPSLISNISSNLLNDLSRMDAATHQFYYPLIQSMIGSLLRLRRIKSIDCQQICYIDCQIRLYVEFILDMISACMLSVPASIDRPPSFDANLSIDKSMESKLFPHTDWVIDFTSFFANNINTYLFAAETSSPHTLRCNTFSPSIIIIIILIIIVFITNIINFLGINITNSIIDAWRTIVLHYKWGAIPQPRSMRSVFGYSSKIIITWITNQYLFLK